MGQRFAPELQFRIIIPGVQILQPGPSVEPLADEPACLRWRGGEDRGGVEHLAIGPIGHLARPRPRRVGDQDHRSKLVVVQIADDAIAGPDVRVRRANLR